MSFRCTFVLLSLVSVLACVGDTTSPASTPEPPVDSTPEPHTPPPGESPDATVLFLSMPGGENQTVHPDYVAMPREWAPSSRYLVVTPYPFGNANKENPTLYAGSAATTWWAPAGVRSPLVSPSSGNLSDPDIVYARERGEISVYYRSVDTKNEVNVIRSTDGVRFSAPRLAVAAPNHELVSPSVVHRASGEWLMWSVNANVGCTGANTSVELRRSANGLDWSPPQTVELTQPGFYPWHIDVQWIPSLQQYWAVFNGKLPGSCTTPALFIATSADGVSWTTLPAPILSRGTLAPLWDVVYRTTFAYHDADDSIDFWYSGARYSEGQYVWQTVHQRRSRVEVFATASRALPPMWAAQLRASVPPLTDPP